MNKQTWLIPCRECPRGFGILYGPWGQSKWPHELIYKNMSTKILPSPPPHTSCPFQEELPSPGSWWRTRGPGNPMFDLSSSRPGNTRFLILLWSTVYSSFDFSQQRNLAFHGCSIEPIFQSRASPYCPLTFLWLAWWLPFCMLSPLWNTSLQQSSTQV